MIDYKDIKKAINNQLDKTDVEIQSRDVREGFNRPSFFVQLDNVERSGTPTQIELSLTVRIYYFPTDPHEYAIEVLEMQDWLSELFDLKLKVKDRLLPISEINSKVTEGVLQVDFDMKFEQGREKEKEFDDFREEHPYEDMENLYYESE